MYANAEWPLGFPYIFKVDVRVSCRIHEKPFLEKWISNLRAILPFNDKFVLQHDQIPFSWFVAQESLELSAKSIKEVPIPDLDLLIREKTHPFQTRDDASRLLLARELAGRFYARDEGTLK